MARKPKVTFRMTDRRRLERQVAAQAEPVMQDMVRARMVETLNGLVPECQGRPVDEVKAAVVSALAAAGLTLPEPELTQYAQEIADGGSFHL